MISNPDDILINMLYEKQKLVMPTVTEHSLTKFKLSMY